MQENNLEENIFIGRQPIFDKKLNVHAYELLFRSSDIENTDFSNGDLATTNVLLNAFTEIGLSQVVGDHNAYINLTRNHIINPPPLPKDRVVIELLEDIEVDSEIINSVEELNKNGYKIALDDFKYQESKENLVKLADLIKLDIQQYTPKTLREVVDKLAPFNKTLLAEKIETHEEFELCKELGFTYFQGYFLCKPNIVKGKKSSADKLTVTRLIAELRNPQNQVTEIEKLLANDPTLSYKLLKIINSAAYAKANKIETLQQAIVYMGLEKLREWASIIAMGSVESRSPELMLTAMVRAKMCEILAKAKGFDAQADRYFMVGLFSMLDALLDEEMVTLLDKINVDDDIRSALLDNSGSMGYILKNVLSYETADWDALSVEDIESGVYRDAYLESINWSMETSKAMVA